MKQMQRQSPDILFDARWRALVALADAGEPTTRFKGTNSLQDQEECEPNIFCGYLT
jgi:hypothetical protein